MWTLCAPSSRKRLSSAGTALSSSVSALIQKASSEAVRKRSDSKTGWYVRGRRKNQKIELKKIESTETSTPLSKVMGMFVQNPCCGRLPTLIG